MSYHNYTNYATNRIHLWITDDAPSYRYWTVFAQKLLNEQRRPKELLRDALRNHFCSRMPRLQGMWSDLLDNTLEEVNWLEIADKLTEGMEREQ